MECPLLGGLTTGTRTIQNSTGVVLVPGTHPIQNSVGVVSVPGTYTKRAPIQS